MKTAAITITYNRLDLTKRTWDSFNEKTGVDFHLFVDNGSTDGTIEWLDDKYKILLGENLGIATAFAYGVSQLEGYDYILKLDNDIETVTEDIINKMVQFIKKNGAHCVSPIDLMIDPKFYPKILNRRIIDGQIVQYTTHTGGAFQLAPYAYVKKLCDEYVQLKAGDYVIGSFYRRKKCPPCYLTDLHMKHIGLNRTSPNYIL